MQPPGKIFTLDADLPLKPGDHFLRALPSGDVEDYVVDDPGFHAAFHAIPAQFQAKVHRADRAAAPKQEVIDRIVNNYHVIGDNARVAVGTDNSINIANRQLQPPEVAGLVEQIRQSLGALPESQRTEMAAPLALLDDEVKKPAPDQSKLKEGLSTVRKIAESLTGSLIASGIRAMINHQLGGPVL